MLATLLLAFVAFSLAYGYLMAVRMRLGRLEDRSAVARLVAVGAPGTAPAPGASPSGGSCPAERHPRLGGE